MIVILSSEQISESLIENPDEAMEVLADLADAHRQGCQVIPGIVRNHACSIAHCAVAPFLRELTAALEHLEANPSEYL